MEGVSYRLFEHVCKSLGTYEENTLPQPHELSSVHSLYEIQLFSLPLKHLSEPAQGSISTNFTLT